MLKFIKKNDFVIVSIFFTILVLSLLLGTGTIT